MMMNAMLDACFIFNDTATTEIYTLSLHDALPISCGNIIFKFDGTVISCDLQDLNVSNDNSCIAL